MNVNQLHQSIQKYLKTRLPDYLGYLRSLVEINSFTSNVDGVNAVGESTSELFSTLDFKAIRVPSGNSMHGDHLVLTKTGALTAPPKGITFISHLDTVFSPDEERRNDFKWREEGSRIYGPGTIDIKGGTVMIFMVLDAIRWNQPELFESVNWTVMLNAAEENLVEEFRQVFIDHKPEGSLACLIFEGGRWNGNKFSLVTARKGRAAFQITIIGRAAHAGAAHQNGANAVVQLAKTISQIAELTDYKKQITYNVGTAAGGTVINRVPHFAAASGEIRAFTPEDLERAVNQLMTLADEVEVRSYRDNYPCQIDIEILAESHPWPSNKGSKELYDTWQQAAESIGFETFEEQRGGLSDGNLLWDLVPTLDGLGPSGGNAHCSERSEDGSKDQEFVRISSLIPKATLNAMAIHRLLTLNGEDKQR
jgi:glutamate carboxypeptidase